MLSENSLNKFTITQLCKILMESDFSPNQLEIVSGDLIKLCDKHTFINTPFKEMRERRKILEKDRNNKTKIK